MNVVTRGYVNLALAVLEQSCRYARGDVSCNPLECKRCKLHNTCVILRQKERLIKEAQEYVTSDEFVEFCELFGLEYSKGDYAKIFDD